MQHIQTADYCNGNSQLGQESQMIAIAKNISKKKKGYGIFGLNFALKSEGHWFTTLSK